MFAAQQHNCCVTWWHFRFYSVTIYRFFGGCDLNASLKALQYAGPFPIFKKCSRMKHIQVSVSVWTSMQFTKSLRCLIEGKSLCCLKIQGLNTAEFWRLVSLQRTWSTSACVVYQTQVCHFSSYHVELHSAIKPLLKIEQTKVDFWKAEKEMNKKKIWAATFPSCSTIPYCSFSGLSQLFLQTCKQFMNIPERCWDHSNTGLAAVEHYVSVCWGLGHWHVMKQH